MESTVKELRKESNKRSIMKSVVKKLRQNGYKVTVSHVRERGPNNEISPKGGKTLVAIYSPNHYQDYSVDNNCDTYFGTARCSEKDNYCKKMGVRIAVGRALKNSGIIEELKNA